MNVTYYLNGEAYTFDNQEKLDAWLAENPTASKTNDKVDFKPSTDFNVEPIKQEVVEEEVVEEEKISIVDKITNRIKGGFDALVDLKEGNFEEPKEDPIVTKRKEEQKEQLNKQLDSAFFDNPTLFGKIIENSENLSLQDREIDAGMFSSPQDYLYDLVKKEIGGFGLFGGDRKTPEGFRSQDGEIIGTKGDIYYPDLSNADIETIVEERFQLQLQDEKLNKYNTRALNKAGQIELSENGDVRELSLIHI